MEDENETAAIVNIVFRHLTNIFPAFKQAWPTQADFEAAKREWTKAFIQVGLRDLEKIKHGLENFRILPNPFVPSPGQFIAMCKPNPESFGIKPLHLAYKEACKLAHPQADKSKCSHPVIYHAMVQTGAYELSRLPINQSYPLFERNYLVATSMFMKGEPLIEIPKAITDSQEKKKTKEVALTALGEMKELLNAHIKNKTKSHRLGI